MCKILADVGLTLTDQQNIANKPYSFVALLVLATVDHVIFSED